MTYTYMSREKNDARLACALSAAVWSRLALLFMLGFIIRNGVMSSSDENNEILHIEFHIFNYGLCSTMCR